MITLLFFLLFPVHAMDERVMVRAVGVRCVINRNFHYFFSFFSGSSLQVSSPSAGVQRSPFAASPSIFIVRSYAFGGVF
jgi:hypothetical protein